MHRDSVQTPLSATRRCALLCCFPHMQHCAVLCCFPHALNVAPTSVLPTHMQHCLSFWLPHARRLVLLPTYAILRCLVLLPTHTPGAIQECHEGHVWVESNTDGGEWIYRFGVMLETKKELVVVRNSSPVSFWLWCWLPSFSVVVVNDLMNVCTS